MCMCVCAHTPVCMYMVCACMCMHECVHVCGVCMVCAWRVCACVHMCIHVHARGRVHVCALVRVRECVYAARARVCVCTCGSPPQCHRPTPGRCYWSQSRALRLTLAGSTRGWGPGSHATQLLGVSPSDLACSLTCRQDGEEGSWAQVRPPFRMLGVASGQALSSAGTSALIPLNCGLRLVVRMGVPAPPGLPPSV